MKTTIEIIKDFLIWIEIKKILHNRTIKPPYFKEGEMWWCHLGENVGSEVDGKGDFFTRPVIVYKKLGSESLLAIPTSTKQKQGSWYVSFKYKGIHELALLSQIRVISFRRLKEKIGTIADPEMHNIKQGFLNLYS